MKRFHIHIGVEQLEESIRFYSTLFGAEPVKTKTDYVKWLLHTVVTRCLPRVRCI